MRAATVPLPGSVPYESIRPFRVTGPYDGLSLIEFLCTRHPHVGEAGWRSALSEGRLHVDGRRVKEPDRVVRAGNQLQHHAGTVTEPSVDAQLALLHNDASLLAVNKPAPLPVHPCGRFNKNTAHAILETMFPDENLRPVHRLDADTTGVWVLAKSRDAARELAQQFEYGQAKKTYLARVAGRVTDSQHIETAVGAGTLPGGARKLDGRGLPSSTHVTPRRAFDDGTTLLELRPATGRTNQIRLHLEDAGFPIVGDTVYSGETTDVAGAGFSSGPICLHAWKLSVRHPDGGQLELVAPEPDWAVTSGA